MLSEGHPEYGLPPSGDLKGVNINEVKKENLMEAFLGTILPWPMNWAPAGWALCDGSLLPINQNQALFSLIGTTYGGNGTSNFAVPNLCGRTPIGAGNGPGLTPKVFGATYGAESAALTANNLPAHTHTLTASSADTGLTQAPAPGWTLGAASSNTGGRAPAIVPVPMYNAATPATPVPSAPTSVAGSSNPAPISTLPPTLCMMFIICTNGFYPARP